MTMLLRGAVVLGGVIILCAPARAGVVSLLPGGSLYPMPEVNYSGAGPQDVGSGITWSSTNGTFGGGSLYGSAANYNFGDNGIWNSGIGPMAGLNSRYPGYGLPDSMTFAFATPVFGVGGFVNYVPGRPNPTIIAVYDSGHNLIESTTLTFLTGGGINTGKFIGFLEPIPNISFFTLSDNYIGITGLTVEALSTPEPSYFASLGLALVGLAAYGRRSKKS